MQSRQFSPSAIQVKPGDTIVWSNSMSGEHTTTSGTNLTPDGMWDSGLLDESETYSVTFDVAGTYAYYCQVHGDRGMIGSVTVQP